MDGSAILARWQMATLGRTAVEAEWRTIAEHLRPLRGDLADGVRPNNQMMDATGAYAGRNLGSGIYGALTNPANRWFEVTAVDEADRKSTIARQWFSEVTSILHRSLSSTFSAFYGQVPATFEDIGFFGGAPFFSQQISGTTQFVDKAISIWDAWPVWDQNDQLIGFYRKCRMPILGLIKQFGAAAVPARLTERMDANPGERIEVLHAVEENLDFEEGRIGPKGKRFTSSYVLLSHERGRVVSQGGYDDMPYDYPRWATPAGDDYPQGPGWDALVDARILNGYERANIQIARRNAEPPLLAPDKGVIQVLRAVPGGVTYGAVTRQGARLVEPLDNGHRPQLALEISAQKREAIKDAFFWSIMQLVGRTGMSATEVMERSEEKGRLMGPHIGRIQTGFLSPLIERRFNALWRAGQLPPPPDGLAGAPMTFEYTSPLSAAARSMEAQATVRVLQVVAELGQAFPGMRDRIDEDAALDRIQEGFGAPAAILRDPRIVAEARAAREEQAAQAQQLAGAREGAAAARDIGAAMAAMAPAAA